MYIINILWLMLQTVTDAKPWTESANMTYLMRALTTVSIVRFYRNE